MKKIASIVIIFGLFVGEFGPLSVDAATLTTSSSVSGSSLLPINSANNQTMGIANKEQGPTVNVSFSSNGLAMTQGSKITAIASPGYFKDDSSKLYYTWYLKREGCGLGASPSSRCDLDNDGRITTNDWKIAAAQIIIKGSYDNTDEKYTASIDSRAAGYEAYPSPTYDKEWIINSGADINDKDAPNCYVQEPKSGLIYEMRRVDQTIQTCPDGYRRVCATSGQSASCDVLNPAYDENQAILQGSSYVVPKTISRTTNKFCAITNDAPVDVEDVYCQITDIANYVQEPRCYDNGVAMCVKYSSNPSVSGNVVFPDTVPVTNPLAAVIFKKDNLCSSLNPNGSQPPAWLDSQRTLYDGLENQTCEKAQNAVFNGDAINPGDSNVVLKCSSEKAGNVCKHLFPKEPKDVGIVGDGKFTLEEKEFWGANPATSSTNGSGVDEANIVGLGVDKFTWMYSAGDMVGVVVEGDSAFATNHADSSYKRMWAFSKNTCKALDDLASMETATANTNDGIQNKNRRNLYLEGPGGGTCDLSDKSKCVGFLTTEIDLNDCLEENLIDPSSDGNEDTSSKLSLQVISNPANPINDPSGNGDILQVSTVSFNSQDSGNLLYNWSVQISRDGSEAPIDTTGWKDITSNLEQNNSFSVADVSGIDKKALAIKLNLSDDLIKSNTDGNYNGVFYLRIKAKTKGTATDGSQNAEGYTIVKIRQQQNEIRMYSVVANNAGMLSMDEGGQEICSSDVEKTKCYVTNNEIIGLSVPNSGDNKLSNFTWKVNGSNLTCNSSISSQCQSDGGNRVFVPILGNVGEAVDVTVSAINIKTSEAVEISRHFIITKPQVLISSGNENSLWPKLIGYYKDLSGNKYPDYSTSVYEAPRDGIVNILATFYPNSMGNQSEIEWFVDGEAMYDFINQKQMVLQINKPEGDNYNVNLSVKYKAGSDTEINNIRKALLKDWNVETENVMDESQDVGIQINVLPTGTQKIASADNQGILASLISHLPENLIFLLKIILTSGGLLLLTGIVFAILPENVLEKDRK